MDLYISFYDNYRGNENYIIINNGFSFGRDKKEGDVDLLLDSEDKKSSFILRSILNKYKPNRVWCSLTYTQHYLFIKKFINDSWIIGGPFVTAQLTNNDFINEFSSKPEIIYSTIEQYLGKPTSSDFDPYFSDFINGLDKDYHIVASASLSNVCYWNKCGYCTYNKTGSNYIRQDIDKIMDSLLMFFKKSNHDISYFHLCVPATPPNMLQKIIDTDKRLKLRAYLRPDEPINEVISSYDKTLENFTFSLGPEGFSQSILDELEKGFTVKDTMFLIEELMKRKAVISISLMNGYTFLTREIVDDYKHNVGILNDLIKKYNYYDKLNIFFGDTIYWSKKEDAEKWGSTSRKGMFGINEVYMSNIIEGTEMFKLNEEIEDFMMKHNVHFQIYHFQKPVLLESSDKGSKYKLTQGREF